MQWFKKHPEFLRSEGTLLSNDSNYRETHQFRDNLFLSCGNIIVRLDEIHKNPILLVYTDATPYQLPLVFPLLSEISKNELEQLAAFSLQELVARIEPKIKFFYELRHQNSSGSLCILEWDNLDDGSKFFGATTILKRLRDWFAGVVTGNYPPDNQEVEYCAHFKKVDIKSSFLYPEEFLKPELVKGSFFGARIKNAIDNKGGIFIGCLIDGFTRAGLIAEISRYLFSEPVDEKLKTSFDFQNETALVNSYIQNGRLLHGLWFQIDVTLPPFKAFPDLIKLIGRGNFDKGVEEFASNGYSYFGIQALSEIVIAIRYPNKKGRLEFQAFRVFVKENADPPILDRDPIKKMRNILDRYDIVEAIPCEKFTAETFHLRNSTRAIHETLKDKAVNIFGVGSLGSEISDCLAKAGIGNISLFDNQRIAPSNPVRHLAGINYVGNDKVNAVKHLLRNHNPFINVNEWFINLYASDLLFMLEKNSMTISSVADDNLEGFISEQAVIANKTMFYVRALRGGKVARIFRVIPGQDACFECLNIYRQEESQFIKILPDESLPTLLNECNNPVRPGSAADLKLIASIASRIVIDHMQKGFTQDNHWIWSTEKIDGSPISDPFKLYSQHIPPHPKCFYCNHEKKLTVSVTKATLQKMKGLVGEKTGIETGGVLAGALDKDGNIMITDASCPGPKAIHKQIEFRKDVEFCQDFLDELYTESNRQTFYVGEWHSHPTEDNSPSGIDIKSLSEIGMQKEYLTLNPVMIIFSNAGDPSCSIHPAGKLHYFVKLQILE